MDCEAPETSADAATEEAAATTSGGDNDADGVEAATLGLAAGSFALFVVCVGLAGAALRRQRAKGASPYTAQAASPTAAVQVEEPEPPHRTSRLIKDSDHQLEYF